MVQSHTVLQSLVTALKESGRLPSATTYSTWELDQDNGQANVKPPVVEITSIDVARSRPHNTDLIDHVTNDDGQEIGYLFRALFEMPVQIDVWTAEGDRYNPKEIGEQIRYALYEYDSAQLGNPLPDPDDPSTPLDGIDHFTLDDGQVANDLSMTPALRRWRQSAEVWFHETINTAAEYGPESPVTTVKSGDGDVIASDDPSEVEQIDVASVTQNGVILYDATPGTESTADDYN